MVFYNSVWLTSHVSSPDFNIETENLKNQEHTGSENLVLVAQDDFTFPLSQLQTNDHHKKQLKGAENKLRLLCIFVNLP